MQIVQQIVYWQVGAANVLLEKFNSNFRVYQILYNSHIIATQRVCLHASATKLVYPIS